MLPGLKTIEALDERLSYLMTVKKDYVADTRKLRAVVSNDDKPSVYMEVDGHGEFPIRPIAHDQIGSYTKIPGRYYDRMLAEAPHLLVDNVNHWLHKQPAKRMVRTLEGNMRAFLSNAYQRIDNENIAKAAFPILLNDPTLRIVSSEVTERRLYIQAVTSRITKDVKKDDAVQAGVIISNSEVGAGSVSVAPVVWRLRCLNGMVCPDSRYRAFHIGKRIEDNAALWREDTQRADDHAILLKVRDMTHAALDEIHFTQRVEKMKALAGMEVTGDPAAAVEVLSNKIGASEAERGSILASLFKEKDTTAWGLINAVTHQGHTAHSYDRAVEFEEAGGKLLELSSKDWKEILDAKKD